MDENKLWINYLNNVKDNDLISLKTNKDILLASKSYDKFTEKEFIEKLKNDKDFCLKWGIIQS